MGTTVNYFMLPDDERTLFRALVKRELTLYPETVPPDWVPLKVDEHAPERLELTAYYIAAERIGPVIVHPVKRGKDKGLMRIEEIPSPVFHYERSFVNEDGELVGGRIWAELDVTDGDANAAELRYKPGGLRVIFEDVRHLFQKSFRRSDPKGYWVGPAAARAVKSQGLVLREPGHRGGTIGVWK